MHTLARCGCIFFWQLAFLCLRNEVGRHEEVPEGPGYGLKSRGSEGAYRGPPYVYTMNYENQEYHMKTASTGTCRGAVRWGWQTSYAGEGGAREVGEAPNLGPRARRHRAGGGVELDGR